MTNRRHQLAAVVTRPRKDRQREASEQMAQNRVTMSAQWSFGGDGNGSSGGFSGDGDGASSNGRWAVNELAKAFLLLLVAVGLSSQRLAPKNPSPTSQPQCCCCCQRRSPFFVFMSFFDTSRRRPLRSSNGWSSTAFTVYPVPHILFVRRTIGDENDRIAC